MADKFSKSSKKFDADHAKRIAQIERRVRAIYKKAAEEAALIATGVKGLGKKPFSFDDYPVAKEKADKLIQQLGESMETLIVNGVKDEWQLANEKNDALSRLYFGNDVDKLTPELFKQYFSNNDGRAVDAFLQRKAAGLNLSDNVWRYTDGFKNEIEMALDLGIREGKSAAAMSRDLREYLQYPNKLFRRVRDEHGVLHLSKAAKAFHPKRGVYRSSYMNARRLAVTETNIAYRTADHQRHQQLDFIVGIRIVLSNNHNCKGVPSGMFFDICDELKGDYPKDFMFTGWHPHCRCHVETILKTPAEMKLDTDRILHGRPTAGYSRNSVKEMPKNFQNWVREHKDKILDAQERGKLPYFLKDNKDKVNQMIDGKLNQTLSTLKIEQPKWYNTPESADAALRDTAGSTWNSLSEIQKDSLEEYTGDGFALINRMLRNQPLQKWWTPQQINAAKKHAKNIEKAIDQSELTSGIWVQRVETMDGLSKFGIKNAYGMSDKDMMKLVGKTGTEDAFMSTCVVKGKARMIDGDKDIIYDIKVPQGSKALYTEPFSTYGAGAGRSWDGISKQKQIGSEAELLLQKGSTFKITKVWKDEDGFWRIEMELQSQTQKLQTIQERAAQRHAARTPEQQKKILDAWNQRKAKYAAIEKEAKDMQSLFNGISDVDTKKLKKALKDYDLKNVQAETAKLKKMKVELEGLTKLDDPFKVARDFSIADAKSVNKAVIDRMSKEHFSSLEAEKKWLESEIKWVETHKKYNTWTAARDAYKKELAFVQRKLDMKEVEDSVMEALAYSKTSRSKPLRDLADEVRKMLSIPDVDIAAAKKKAADLNAKYQQLNKAKKPKLPKSEKIKFETIDDLKKRMGADFPKTLPNLEDAIAKYEKGIHYGDIAKLHKQEIEELMRKVFDTHDLGMNIDDDTLEAVLNSWFKNTFETGTSGGHCGSTRTTGMIPVNHARLSAAHNLFGLGKKLSVDQLARHDYEKYGNLLDHNILASMRNNTATQYGNVEIRFKKDKVTCTWTAGDSLSEIYQPSLVSDPRSCSFDDLYKTPTTAAEDVVDLAKFKRKHISSYLELQYHGELGIDCVESLTFPYNVKTSHYKDVALKWKAKGVKVYYIDNDTLYEL